METFVTYMYLLCDLGMVVLLVCIAYQSVMYAHVWHFNLRLIFGLLYAMEYEVYREVSRLAGLPVVVSDLRIHYVCGLYLLIGLFIREVMYNAERYEISLVQTRAGL